MLVLCCSLFCYGYASANNNDDNVMKAARFIVAHSAVSPENRNEAVLYTASVINESPYKIKSFRDILKDLDNDSDRLERLDRRNPIDKQSLNKSLAQLMTCEYMDLMMGLGLDSDECRVDGK